MSNWREEYNDLSLAGLDIGLHLDLMRLEPEEDAEKRVEETGLYVGCADFMEVCNASQRIATAGSFPRKFYNEPTIQLFHTLALHLCPPDFLEPVTRELRYNPGNHSSSNPRANSYRYFMLIAALEPFSGSNDGAHFKIEGIGDVSRQMLRLVLFGTDEA